MSSFNLNQAHFNTQAIHAGYRRDSDFGALATPIYQTSTFTFTSADHAMGVFSGDIPGYDYTRAGNPTVRVFEEKIAQLECGEDAVATSSGMGAIAQPCWACCAPATTIVCGNTVYGCTDVVMREILPSLDITVTFVDTGDLSAVEQAIQANTKVIYFETPANPTMHVTDIAAVAALKQAHPGIRIVVDNTFAPAAYPVPPETGRRCSGAFRYKIHQRTRRRDRRRCDRK